MLELKIHRSHRHRTISLRADNCPEPVVAGSIGEAIRYQGQIRRGIVIATCLAVIVFVAGANAQAGLMEMQATVEKTQDGAYSLKFDNSKIIGLAHSTPQEMGWFVKGEHEIYAARVAIRPYLSADDAILDNRIYYNIGIDGSIDSYAERDDEGNLRITINTGLIKAIDGLAWAQVMGAEYNDHACFLNYLRYISSQPRGTVQSPPHFAISHAALCPVEGISLLIHGPTGHDKELSQECFDLQSLGLIFVILHEFAHIKYNDPDIKSSRLKIRRKEEKIADEFAGVCMQRIKADPLFTLPALLLFARLEGRKQTDEINDHPSALERMQAMITLSRRRISSSPSKELQPLTTIQESEKEIVTGYVSDLLAEARKK